MWDLVQKQDIYVPLNLNQPDKPDFYADQIFSGTMSVTDLVPLSIYNLQEL